MQMHYVFFFFIILSCYDDALLSVWADVQASGEWKSEVILNPKSFPFSGGLIVVLKCIVSARRNRALI